MVKIWKFRIFDPYIRKAFGKQTEHKFVIFSVIAYILLVTAIFIVTLQSIEDIEAVFVGIGRTFMEDSESDGSTSLLPLVPLGAAILSVLVIRFVVLKKFDIEKNITYRFIGNIITTNIMSLIMFFTLFPLILLPIGLPVAEGGWLLFDDRTVYLAYGACILISTFLGGLGATWVSVKFTKYSIPGNIRKQVIYEYEAVEDIESHLQRIEESIEQNDFDRALAKLEDILETYNEISDSSFPGVSNHIEYINDEFEDAASSYSDELATTARSYAEKGSYEELRDLLQYARRASNLEHIHYSKPAGNLLNGLDLVGDPIALEILSTAAKKSEKAQLEDTRQLLSMVDEIRQYFDISRNDDLQETTHRLVRQTLSNARPDDRKEYGDDSAGWLLLAIQVTELPGYSGSGRGPESKQVSSQWEDFIDYQRQNFDNTLEQAQEAQEAGNYSEARQQQDAAHDILDKLEEAADKHDVAPEELGIHLASYRKQVVDEVEQSTIQELKDTISNENSIDKSKIDIRDGDPEDYRKLREVLDYATSSIDGSATTLPWEAFNEAIHNDLQGLTTEDVERYHNIISDIEEIQDFIDVAPDAHPSIDREAWREAMETAVTHQSRATLTPITSQIGRMRNGRWDHGDILRMSWEDFEHLVGHLYEDIGYNVEVTQGSVDRGVDAWAKKDGERVAIQIKQFSEGNTVGRRTLQNIGSTIAAGDADKAVVVTSSEFTRGAEDYQGSFEAPMEIVDGDELVRMLNRSSIPSPD